MRRQPRGRRLARSRAVRQRLYRLPVWRRAKTLLCYVAIDGEVETRPLLARALAEGKRVAVPVVPLGSHRIAAVEIEDVRRDLRFRGPLGAPEPTHRNGRIPLEQLELVLVPGVAFDRQGRRLGRGGGHFDRFLARIPPGIPRIGLAFRFQVVEQLPSESHDQPVWRVITG